MRISIGICTFRRPHVAETLRAVLDQAAPMGLELEVIVADNDDFDTARSIVETAAATATVPLRYIHAPARNISIARNAVLDAAGGDWIAFLDDDETVGPGWINRLASCARRTGADVVFGPVAAAYPPDAPAWVVAGDFHSTHIQGDPGRRGEGHSGNVLFRWRGAPWSAVRFDLSLGRSGGEDTAFFDALRRFGARCSYEPDAIVREAAPAERLNFDWLWRRRIRYGQTHARLRLRDGAFAATACIVAGLKAALCLSVATACAPIPLARRRWLLRAALHLGAAGRFAGARDVELY